MSANGLRLNRKHAVLTLKRFADTEQGTPGRLGKLYTMERPNLDNQENVSRIPAGEYTCVRTWYHKGKYDTYEIVDVPDRKRILFHIGNRMVDVKGCVALGLRFGTYKGQLAVLDSGIAFRQFMDDWRGVLSFKLRIEDE